MAPRVITIHDGGQQPVEDLRGLTKLARRAKEAAGIVTALGVLFAGITGGARLAIRMAGLATSVELTEKTAPIVAAQQEAARVAATDKAAILGQLAALQKTADTTAATVARLEKHRAGGRKSAAGE